MIHAGHCIPFPYPFQSCLNPHSFFFSHQKTNRQQKLGLKKNRKNNQRLYFQTQIKCFAFTYYIKSLCLFSLNDRYLHINLKCILSFFKYLLSLEMVSLLLIPSAVVHFPLHQVPLDWEVYALIADKFTSEELMLTSILSCYLNPSIRGTHKVLALVESQQQLISIQGRPVSIFQGCGLSQVLLSNSWPYAHTGISVLNLYRKARERREFGSGRFTQGRLWEKWSEGMEQRWMDGHFV